MLDQSLNYIDDLESLSIIKDGVYKDTYFCVYKGKRAILSQYRLDTNPYNLDPKRIILGSGSDQIFELICKSFLNKNDEVIVPE